MQHDLNLAKELAKAALIKALHRVSAKATVLAPGEYDLLTETLRYHAIDDIKAVRSLVATASSDKAAQGLDCALLTAEVKFGMPVGVIMFAALLIGLDELMSRSKAPFVALGGIADTVFAGSVSSKQLREELEARGVHRVDPTGPGDGVNALQAIAVFAYIADALTSASSGEGISSGGGNG